MWKVDTSFAMYVQKENFIKLQLRVLSLKIGFKSDLKFRRKTQSAIGFLNESRVALICSEIE